MSVGIRVGIRAGASVGVAGGVGADPLGGGVDWLVVFAGQSNATTHDVTSNLSAANIALGFLDPFGRVRMLSKQAPTIALAFQEDGPQAMAPLVYDGGTKMGFDLSLMRNLDTATPGRFAMVRYAVGGSEAADWDTYKTAFSAYVLAAKATLGARNILVVWEQGEADARDLTKANAYAAWLGTFVTWIRTQFGATCPFVYGKLNVNVDGVFYAFKTELRASQDTYNALAVSGVYMVNQDGVALSGDNAHYDANGYILVGNAFTTYTATAAGVFVPPVAAFTHSELQRAVTLTDTSAVYNTAIASYLWTPSGAGTFTTGSATSQNPVFTFTSDGTYSITMQITDVRGRVSTTTTTGISVIGGIVGVSRDALSGYYVPATAAEWNTFLGDVSVGLGAHAAPTSLYLCQEASGNLTDTISAITLTAANTPAYSQAITGMTRVGVKCADGTAKTFASTSASLPDIATSDVLALVMGLMPASAPAANRNIVAMGVGANRTHAGLESTGKGRATCGANTALTAASVVDGTLEIVVCRLNNTAGVPSETDSWFGTSRKISPTLALTAAGKRLEIGAQSGALSASDYIYAYLVLFSTEDWSDTDVETLITKLKGL